MAKVNVTLSIDEEIKQAFKIQCVMNGHEMSEVTENFMSDYVEKSIELRKERENRDNNNGEK